MPTSPQTPPVGSLNPFVGRAWEATVDSQPASRLEILEAVAAVLDDPTRFLTIVSGCSDNDEAVERVMGEYNVSREAATHMLATNFRRATSAERAKMHEEIESVRRRLAV